MIKPWKTLKSTVVHETPWIAIKEDVCQVEDTTLTYTYTHRKDQGPLIIAEEADGRLWLVRQYRHPIKKIIWQFPAEGKLPNETWEAAAQRGIEEELGKHAQTITRLSQLYPDPGGLEQMTYIFVASNLQDTTSTNHHTTGNEVEDLEIKAFTLEEIDQLLEKGEICDGWTVAALYMYLRFKKFQ